MAVKKVTKQRAKRAARTLAAAADGKGWHPKSRQKKPTVARNEDSYPDPELFKRVVQSVENGAPASTAMYAAGMTASQIVSWAQRAKRGDVAYIEFFDALRQAEAKPRVRWAGLMELAARGDKVRVKTDAVDANGNPVYREMVPDTTALKFLLERRDPRNWARTEKHELTGRDGAPINQIATPFQFDRNFKGWSDEEIETFLNTGKKPEHAIKQGMSPTDEARLAAAELEGFGL